MFGVLAMPVEWCTVALSDGEYYGSSGIPRMGEQLVGITLKDGLYADKEVYQFKLNEDGSMRASTPLIPTPKVLRRRPRNQWKVARPCLFTRWKNDLLHQQWRCENNIKVYRFLENNQPALKVYPNPTSNVVNIKGLRKLYG